MQPMTDGADAARKARRDSLLVFGFAFVAYLILRSRSYIGDGIRYLPAMTDPRVPLDGGGAHFLWPYVGWLLDRLWAALGAPSSAANGHVNTGAIELIQGANAFAAALGLALLYLWLRDVATRRAALLGVVLVAFSHAFLLHATDMTEPIAAVAPIMLGLWLLNRTPDRTWAHLAVGALIGLGGDFYQIALLAVAPAAWIAASTPARVATLPPLPRLVRVGIEIGGAALATYGGLIAAVRLVAHPELDIRGSSGPSATALFGSLNPKHFAAGIFGFANSIAQLPSVEGMSQLFHETPGDLSKTLAITALALAFAVGLVLRLARSRARLIALGRWPNVVAAAGWFAVVACAACYWSPLYEKFWLFSLPPLAMAVALAIEPAGDGSGESQSAAERRWPLFLVPAAVLLLLSVSTGAMSRRFRHNADVDVATGLADRLRATDLLVTPGWDVPSVYLRNIVDQPVDCFDITDEMVALSYHSPQLVDRLAARVDATRARGGRVYFLGLLDVSPAEWSAFYGSRLKLPFEALASYRPLAVPAETFSVSPPLVLYEVPAPP
jgi:hypothetical protein